MSNQLILSAINQIENTLSKIPSRDLSYNNFEEGVSHEDSIKIIINSKIAHLNIDQQQRVLSEFHGYGPISNLMENESITEIIVNGPDSIWYETNGQLTKHQDQFASELSYENFLNRVCFISKTNYTLEMPMSDGKLLDFRIHLVSEEITKNKTVLSMRRHPKNPWTLEKLFNSEWGNEMSLSLIKQVINSNENFIVVGSTGSGKTSLLNACLQEIQPNSRSIIIEDTEELRIPNTISTRLLTRKASQGALSNIDQAELLRQALRMRPDRIVMGEIRGHEAKDLLMALSTGHQGSFASLHATDAHQALIRLEMLIQLGAPNWSIEAIRNLIFLSLQKIIVVERNSIGKRVLNGIYRICSRESSGILIDRCA